MADVPPQTISLLDRMNARYTELRARDNTVRRFTTEVKRHSNQMRITHQLRKVAKAAIREQERWLREEAAAQIREEAGVKTIPGFLSKRESAVAFRKGINDKLKAAQADARAKLKAQ